MSSILFPSLWHWASRGCRGGSGAAARMFSAKKKRTLFPSVSFLTGGHVVPDHTYAVRKQKRGRLQPLRSSALVLWASSHTQPVQRDSLHCCPRHPSHPSSSATRQAKTTLSRRLAGKEKHELSRGTWLHQRSIGSYRRAARE